MLSFSKIFLFLWPLSHIFHFQWAWFYIENLNYISFAFAFLVSGAGLILILYPRDIYLLLLVILQLGDAIYQAPHITNHYLVISFVNMSILFFLLFRKYFVFSAWRSSVLISTFVFYFFAFFWKLNSGFLDPNISCANIFSLLIGENVLFRTSFVPYLTLFIEFLIPFLLFVGFKYRAFVKWSFLVGVCFHFILLFPEERFFLNFSFPMFALLSLFINIKNDSLPISEDRIFVFKLFFSFVLLCLIPFAESEPGAWFLLRQGLALLVYILFLSYYLINFSNLDSFKIDFRRFWQKVFLIFPFLFVLNALSPLLGFKNASSFQMYSNLYIDHLSSNHYLLPKSLDLGAYFSDRVKVSKGNNDLKIKQEEWIAYVGLLELCYHKQCNSLEYFRKGKLHYTNGEKEALEYMKLNFLEKKLLRFIPYESSRPGCTW